MRSQKVFFASFKKERVRGKTFESFNHTRRVVQPYIDGFYNPRRRHSHNGGLSPLDFEHNYTKQNAEPFAAPKGYSIAQDELQPSPFEILPSSHCSPAARTPLPQSGGPSHTYSYRFEHRMSAHVAVLVCIRIQSALPVVPPAQNCVPSRHKWTPSVTWSVPPSHISVVLNARTNVFSATSSTRTRCQPVPRLEQRGSAASAVVVTLQCMCSVLAEVL